MKVVLKVTVFDKIMEKVADAKRINRQVQHILVTREEYAEYMPA